MFSRTRHITTFGLLLVFMLFRLSNLHAFTHFEDVDVEHCEHCDMLLKSREDTPFLTGETPELEIEAPSVLIKEYAQPLYEQPLHCFVLPKFLRNKPPPSL